jgi:hypothetical protein
MTDTDRPRVFRGRRAPLLVRAGALASSAIVGLVALLGGFLDIVIAHLPTWAAWSLKGSILIVVVAALVVARRYAVANPSLEVGPSGFVVVTAFGTRRLPWAKVNGHEFAEGVATFDVSPRAFVVDDALYTPADGSPSRVAAAMYRRWCK